MYFLNPEQMAFAAAERSSEKYHDDFFYGLQARNART
jgi:hypothetical protein